MMIVDEELALPELPPLLVSDVPVEGGGGPEGGAGRWPKMNDFGAEPGAAP